MYRLTRHMPDAPETEYVENSKNSDFFMVRPCESYDELYRNCKTFKNRLYQLYVYGSTLDCQEHIDNYSHCMRYRSTQDVSHLNKIIEWEKTLVHTRKMTEKQNDTWELRSEPPKDFSRPLPEYIKERQKDSLFNKKNLWSDGKKVNS